MKSHTSVRLFLVPVLLALFAANAPALGNIVKGKSYLVRSDPVFNEDASVPDADVKGTVSVDTKISTGRQRFEVAIKKVNKAQTYNLFVEDPENEGEFGPAIPFEGTGTSKKVKIDTDKGGILPVGATTVADLAGLEIRVVVGIDPNDEATIYLRGVVPATGLSKEILRAKESLQVNGGPDANATGEIELSSKASTGDERLRVKTKALDFDSFTFSLWIETAPLSGEYVKAGDVVRTAKFKGDIERRTKDGQPLPAGLISATGYVGRRIQIRDQTDMEPVAVNPYLTALIPQFN